MAARRRLMKELQDLKKGGPKYFRDVQVDEQNIFQWQGLLVPEAYPYNKGNQIIYQLGLGSRQDSFPVSGQNPLS